MFRFLSASKRPVSPSRASFRPQLEVLEERALLNATALGTPQVFLTNQRVLVEQATLDSPIPKPELGPRRRSRILSRRCIISLGRRRRQTPRPPRDSKQDLQRRPEFIPLGPEVPKAGTVVPGKDSPALSQIVQAFPRVG
jgi:hypothetical protein